MARKLRVQYPGAVYHVMKRGDRWEVMFNDDQDRLMFLETLGEACEETDEVGMHCRTALQGGRHASRLPAAPSPAESAKQ
jgi:hypothetical protein